MADNKRFEVESLGLVFEIPAEPTARQNLAYKSIIAVGPRAGLYERFWEGLKVLLVEGSWESKYMPDENANLDKIRDPKAVDTITAACDMVAGYMRRLGEVDPN